jgi:hypothetical protein
MRTVAHDAETFRVLHRHWSFPCRRAGSGRSFSSRPETTIPSGRSHVSLRSALGVSGIRCYPLIDADIVQTKHSSSSPAHPSPSVFLPSHATCFPSQQSSKVSSSSPYLSKRVASSSLPPNTRLQTLPRPRESTVPSPRSSSSSVSRGCVVVRHTSIHFSMWDMKAGTTTMS